MFWRLRHHLFGTHFVALRYGYDDSILPVKFTPQGRPYVKILGKFIWIADHSNPWIDNHTWEALTFDKKEWLAQASHAVLPPVTRLVSSK